MCGAVSDLHAADACYHKSCRVTFMSPNSTSAALTVEQEGHEDKSLQVIISVLNENQWNSFEVHTLYGDNGGSDLSCCLLVTRLLEYYGDKFVALSYPRIATILAFRSGAAEALRIIPDEDDGDIDIAVSKLKKKIC